MPRLTIDLLANPVGPSELGRVPPECTRASFEPGGAWAQKCAAQPPFTVADLLIMAGYSPAQVACATTAPGAGYRCKDGAFCVSRPNGDFCTRCDDDGNCHHERGGAGDAADKGTVYESKVVAPPKSEAPHEKVESSAEEKLRENELQKKEEAKRAATEEERRRAEAEAARARQQAEAARQRREQVSRTIDGHSGPETLHAPAPNTGATPAKDPRKPSTQQITCQLARSCPAPKLSSGEERPPSVDRSRAGPAPTTVGDPVAIASGQLLDHAVDLEIAPQPGSSIGFKLERHYSSGGISSGALGRNWTHSYEERIAPVDEFYPDANALPPYCIEALPTIHCIEHQASDGRRVLYVQDSRSLVFLPPPGTYSTVRHIDGRGGWTLREADGTLTVFDGRGRARSKTDRNGFALHFNYGPDDDQPLYAVVDPLQRIIRFEYDTRGRLHSVRDFLGRTVTYGYETLDVRDDVVPGLLGKQSRLTSVEHAAGREKAKWHYRYVPLDDVRARVPRRPSPTPPREEACGQQADLLVQWIANELIVDHLLGNLVEVVNPLEQTVLRTAYQLDPNKPDFDRVSGQQTGSAIDLPVGPKIDFLYSTRANQVPDQVRESVAITDKGCGALQTSHFGRALVINPGPFVFPLQFLRRQVFAESIQTLTADLNTVCQWTRRTDQLGRTTWFGTNYLGQALVMALRGGGPGEPAWFRTERRYDVNGEPSQESSPGGLVTEYTWDSRSPSPLSRGNLLRRRERRSDIQVRQWDYEYEPFYNQKRLERDPLGHTTEYAYDYQEDDPASAPAAIVAALGLAGSTASAMAQLAPNLPFFGMDKNGDGKTDGRAGNLIRVDEPMAKLASGALQPFVSTYRYNVFGQLTSRDEAGRTTTFSYYKANRPSGPEVAIEMTSSYTAYLSVEQRAARHETGGYLASVTRDLRQDMSARAFERPMLQTLTTQLFYDAAGSPLRVLPPSGGERVFEWDGFGQLRRSVDAEGFQQTFVRDPAQNLVRTEEMIGDDKKRVRRFFYDRDGRKIADCSELEPGACDASLRELRGRRASAPKMVLNSYERDVEGQLVDVIDVEGHRHHVDYNSRGLVSRTIGGFGMPQAETTSYKYDEDDLLERITNGAGDEVFLSYTHFGQLRAARFPNGTTVELDIDLDGQSRGMRANDAAGIELSRTSHDLDERHRIRESRESWKVPAGQLPQPGYRRELVTRIEREPHGKATAVTLPSGVGYNFSHDSFGDEMFALDPAGNEQFSYRDVANRLMLSRERGEGRDVLEEVRLDRRGLAVGETRMGRGLSTSSSASYDGLGELLAFVDAQGNRQEFENDLLGRLRFVRTPRKERGDPDLVTEIVYDRRNLVTGVIDPEGVRTSRWYSPAGKLERQIWGDRLRQFDYRYDGAGRLRTVEQGDRTRLSLNWRAGFLRSIDALNDQGTLVGQRWFERDGLGRVVSAWHRSGPFWAVSDLSYDSFDRIVSERTGIRYDANRAGGVPPACSQGCGGSCDVGPPHTVRYAFDDNDALRTIEYPDGAHANLNVDSLGRARTITLGGVRADIGWRGDSLYWIGVSEGQSPAASTEAFFDTLERPTGTEVRRKPNCPLPSCRGTGELAYAETRQLDPLGRIRYQVQRWGTRSRARAAIYSGSGWLEGIVEPAAQPPQLSTNRDVELFVGGQAPWTRFERDRVGTLLRENRGSPLAFDGATLGAQGHTYHSVAVAGSPLPITYDAQSRVKSLGELALGWDAFEHPVDVRTTVSGDPSGLKTYRYVYDAFDRRVARVRMHDGKPGVVEQLVHSGAEVLAAYRGGTLTERILFGPEVDQPLAIQRPSSETIYPYLDVQGNVAGLHAGPAARAVESYAYDAYGNVQTYDPNNRLTCDESSKSVCPTLTAYAYNAQRREIDTGLYDYKARFYSPALRSFLSPDPLDFTDSFNPFVYVGGDPLNFIDPLGLFSQQSSGIRPSSSGRRPKSKGKREHVPTYEEFVEERRKQIEFEEWEKRKVREENEGTRRMEEQLRREKEEQRPSTNEPRMTNPDKEIAGKMEEAHRDIEIHVKTPLREGVKTAIGSKIAEGAGIVFGGIRIDKFAPDWATKGIHIKVKGVELAVRPGHSGTIVFRPVFSSTKKEAVKAATKEATAAMKDPAFRRALHEAAVKATEFLGKSGDPLGIKKSMETNLVAKALEKMGL